MDFNDVAGLHQRNPERNVVEVNTLKGFTPINNKMLIAISPDENELIRGWLHYVDETYLNEKNRYNAYEHTIRHGIVVAQPDKFVYHKKGQQSHNTTIETQIGDDVFFPGSESVNCQLVECKHKYYLLMDYEVLYVAKRRVSNDDLKGDIFVDGKWYQVIPLNGNMLCKNHEEEEFSTLMINKTRKNISLVEVIYAGSTVEYRNPSSAPSKNPSCPEVVSGSMVYLKQNAPVVMMESDLHLAFDKQNNFRVVPRKNVMAML